MMADETNNKLRSEKKRTSFFLSKTFECIVLAFFVACMMLFLLNVETASILKYIGMACIFPYSIFNILASSKYKTFRYDKSILLWIALFAISIVFSGIFSSEIVGGLERAVSIFSLFILSIYLLPCMLSDLKIEVLMRVISNTIFVVLLVCAVLFNDTFSISYDPRRVGAMKRFLAGFSYPSCLGYYCFLGIVCSLYPILLKKESKRARVFSLIKIVFFAVLIFASNTRTTMLITCIFLLIFYYLKKWRKKPLVRIFVIYFTLLAVAVLTILLESGVLSFEKIDLILSYRLTFWGRAIMTVLNSGSFLFGTGIYMDDITSSEFIQIDNGFVKTFYQYGFISVVLLCILLIKIFMALKKKANNDGTAFGEALFLSFVIYCTSESNFYVWVLLPVVVYCISGRFIGSEGTKDHRKLQHGKK